MSDHIEIIDCRLCEHFIPEDHYNYAHCERLKTGYSRQCINGDKFSKSATVVRMYEVVTI